MKKMMLILVMLLIAATSYNQTSRKPANKKETAQKNTRSASVQTTSNRNATHQDRSSQTQRSTQNSNRQSTQSSSTNKQPATSRSSTRTSTPNRNVTTTTTSRSNTANANRQARSTTTSRSSVANSNRSVRRSTTTSGNNRSVNHHSTHSGRSAVVYNSPRVYRSGHSAHHHYKTPPRSIEYRRSHHVYRRPAHFDIYWTPVMHRHFIDIYPMVHSWNYHNGHRIEMISAYDAMYYRGDVRTVYGRVSDVYYARNTDEYFLYFGPFYPYQDFTVVVPGYLARRYSRNPERYFESRHVAVTGLITTFEGEPEIVVKKEFQINLY